MSEYEFTEAEQAAIEKTTADRLAEGITPVTDEQVAQFADLIDMHRQYGPALSIEGEAQLLVEVLRLRARVGVLEGQLATAREELEALEPIAAPRRRTAKEREGYRRHAAWQSAEHYLKQAEAAARKWTREAEWLREFRDERKAETEAGTWPPPGDFDCCADHPAKALGLDGGGSDA